MQDIGSMGNTRGEQRDLTTDGESCLSNPLDTVSPLEIGLHSCKALYRYQSLQGVLDSYCFCSKNILPTH
jgi:hypothetical protein